MTNKLTIEELIDDYSDFIATKRFQESGDLNEQEEQ